MANKNDIKDLNREMSKSYSRKQRKKKRAKTSLMTLFAGLLIFLIATFSGFFGLNPLGVFPDGTGSHSLLRDKPAVEAPIKMAEEQTSLVIYVVDGDYLYMDVTYDLEGITKVIEGIESSEPISLVDKLAQVKAFEDIEEVLNREGVMYNIVEDYE